MYLYTANNFCVMYCSIVDLLMVSARIQTVKSFSVQLRKCYCNELAGGTVSCYWL